MDAANEWILEGKTKWELVQEHGEIVIPWINPWYRFGLLTIVGMIVFAIGHFGINNNSIRYVGIGVAALCGVIAGRFYLKGHLVGGIAASVSVDGCAIGCGHDRLFIPWSSVSTNIKSLPINDQFMLIPIKEGAAGELLIQHRGGTVENWDGRPYKRAVIRAELHMPNEGVRIYAYPNEIMVHFLSMAYPIIAYRAHVGEGIGLSEPKQHFQRARVPMQPPAATDDKERAPPDFLSLLVIVAMAVAPAVVVGFSGFYLVRGLLNGNCSPVGLVLTASIICLMLYLGIRGLLKAINTAKVFPSTRPKMCLAGLIFIVALYVRVYHWH
ncbi:MAG TPA: hypothetical protein VGP72_17080 [Planctomycetota bacterium]|jgi:hypothetical protein